VSGGNIPTASFLDNRVFLSSVRVAEFYDPRVPLPPHDLIFNSIGDADLCRAGLEAAFRVLGQTTAPVLNHPSAVLKTGRLADARRLSDLPGVVALRMIELPRQSLLRQTPPIPFPNRILRFRCCCALLDFIRDTIFSWWKMPATCRAPPRSCREKVR